MCQIQRSALAGIFGDRLPDGATSFFTCDGLTVFLVGRTGRFVTVPWEGDDAARLRDIDALGTFGCEIADDVAATHHTIPRAGDRPAVIEGIQIATASSRGHEGPCEQRWWEMALYRVRDGRYAVHIAYRTQWAGEHDHDALVVSPDAATLVERLDEYQWADRVHGFPRGRDERQATLMRRLGECWDRAVGDLLVDVEPERI